MSFKPLGKELPLSLGDLQNEMNRVFDRFWHGGVSTGPLDGNAWAPPFDVLDEDDRVVVLAEVPGMKADEIEVSYQDECLTLSGQRSSPWPEDAPKKLLRHERRYGAFSRTIELGVEINPDEITATVRHGVMTVTLPKVEPNRGKTIRVDVVD